VLPALAPLYPYSRYGILFSNYTRKELIFQACTENGAGFFGGLGARPTQKKTALKSWLAIKNKQVAVVRCGRLSLVWGGHHTDKQPTIAKAMCDIRLQ